MATPTQMRKLVADVREAGLDKDLPAIAFEASLLEDIDPDSDDALLTPCVLIKPVPHPILKAFLETHVPPGPVG